MVQKKYIEMENMMVASAADDKAISAAGDQIDESVSRLFPHYRFRSQRTYIEGNLLHVARCYQYSQWRAAKVWLQKKLGRFSEPEPIRFIGSP